MFSSAKKICDNVYYPSSSLLNYAKTVSLLPDKQYCCQEKVSMMPTNSLSFVPHNTYMYDIFLHGPDFITVCKQQKTLAKHSEILHKRSCSPANIA